MSNTTGREPFTFEIKSHLGVISIKGGPEQSWRREVNIVSWNGAAPKVDIREWSPDHTRMTRGITLTEDETEALMSVLNARYASIR